MISLKRIIALPYMVRASEQLAQENLKAGRVPKGETMEEPWSNYASLILGPSETMDLCFFDPRTPRTREIILRHASLILGLRGYERLYYGMLL
jgi:hypothetical protein